MKRVTIDISKCNSIKDIYQEIKKALNIPMNFGDNLDALWDSLTGHIEHPIQIRIKGIESLDKELQLYVLKILTVFTDAEEFLPDIQVFIHKAP